MALAVLVAGVAPTGCIYYCRKYGKLKATNASAGDIDMPVLQNYGREESTTTSEISLHGGTVHPQNSITETWLGPQEQGPLERQYSSRSGYQKLQDFESNQPRVEHKLDPTTCDRDDEDQPQRPSNRGPINQSPVELTATTINETCLHSRSVHPQSSTLDIVSTGHKNRALKQSNIHQGGIRGWKEHHMILRQISSWWSKS